jgi:hypothetical protein
MKRGWWLAGCVRACVCVRLECLFCLGICMGGWQYMASARRWHGSAVEAAAGSGSGRQWPSLTDKDEDGALDDPAILVVNHSPQQQHVHGEQDLKPRLLQQPGGRAGRGTCERRRWRRPARRRLCLRAAVALQPAASGTACWGPLLQQAR